MKKCCNNPTKYQIEYDCGVQSQKLELCEYHYNLDLVFQRHIKTIKEVDTK